MPKKPGVEKDAPNPDPVDKDVTLVRVLVRQQHPCYRMLNSISFRLSDKYVSLCRNGNGSQKKVQFGKVSSFSISDQAPINTHDEPRYVTFSFVIR